MPRIIIVDDEPVAIRRISALLRTIEDAAVVASANNAESALELVAEHHPDLVLLDIEMPGANGIKLAETLRALTEPPAIVFITAYSGFALDAFDVAATDYLLKPVEPARLREAVDRVRKDLADQTAARRVGELEDVVRRLRSLELEDDFDDSTLWLSDLSGCHRVRVADVHWMEAERDYVRVHVADRSYLVRGRFGEFASRYRKHGLVRIHRSTLVQLRSVMRIEYRGDRSYRLVLRNGAAIDASRRFASVVRASLGRPGFSAEPA